MREEAEERSCNNCKYAESSLSSLPCSVCVEQSGYDQYWEPAEVDSECPVPATDAPDRVKTVYLIGSLRNPAIPGLANQLQTFLGEGWSVFADWFAAGPEADDYWKKYETARGFSAKEALSRPAARNVFEFDKKHLQAADAVVLAMPAGKSAFLELGWCLGQGKPGFILLNQQDRWDVMFQFATAVFAPDDSYDFIARTIKDHTEDVI